MAQFKKSVVNLRQAMQPNPKLAAANHSEG